jgi:hypothetical protein
LRNVAVSGVGHSEFGVRKDVNLSELTFEAVKPDLAEYVANGWTGEAASRGVLPV